MSEERSTSESVSEGGGGRKRREMEEQMERKGEREDGKGTYGERG